MFQHYNHASEGIRNWTLNTPNEDKPNFPFCRLVNKRLDPATVAPANQNLKVHKVIKPTNKKNFFYKTLGSNVINSPMSPSFPITKIF